MKSYSIGFPFNKNNEVILIRKNRPPWQNSMLNGIGGKVELGELPEQAMIRECEEEAGIRIENWTHCLTVICYEDDAILYIYKTYVENFDNFQAKTDESLEIHDRHNLPDTVIPNLEWIVPLVYFDVDFPIKIFQKSPFPEVRT